jgi:hypothetical protein
MAHDDPPLELAELLGRLLYHAGWVEHSLGELAVLHHPQRAESTDAGWGFSGTRLVTALRKISNPSEQLSNAIDEYESLFQSRNKLIHTGWVVNSPDSVNGLHAPIEKGTPRMSVYRTSYGALRGEIARWERLEKAVDDLISQAMGIQ